MGSTSSHLPEDSGFQQAQPHLSKNTRLPSAFSKSGKLLLLLPSKPSMDCGLTGHLHRYPGGVYGLDKSGARNKHRHDNGALQSKTSRASTPKAQAPPRRHHGLDNTVARRKHIPDKGFARTPNWEPSPKLVCNTIKVPSWERPKNLQW